MPNFSGQLRSNEIFAAIYNMIISQRVFVDNIEGGAFDSLVNRARVDGSLYGDSKLFYSTDVLKTHAWGADSEATNLLALARPKSPECQEIVLDVFRQIDLTVDYYLSKRAWQDEGAFQSFTSVMLGWVTDTKKVHDLTTYNSFFGTNETNVGRQIINVDLTSAANNASSETEKNQLSAMAIGEALANLIVDMQDVSRDFNDYGQLRSFNEETIKMVFNAKHVNRIKYIDLPTIFHKEGIEAKVTKDILPARYFGTVITSSNISSFSDSTPAAGKPIDSDNNQYTPGSNHANGCIRSLVEKEVTVGGVTKNYFPGDELPAGATIVASTGNWLPGEVYIEKDDVICKVYTEEPPFMSAFEVGTSFFNPKSLTENHYLTWGRNRLEHLKGKPFITVKAV